jgi:hypothetical protein
MVHRLRRSAAGGVLSPFEIAISTTMTGVSRTLQPTSRYSARHHISRCLEFAEFSLKNEAEGKIQKCCTCSNNTGASNFDSLAIFISCSSHGAAISTPTSRLFRFLPLPKPLYMEISLSVLLFEPSIPII